MPTIEFFVPGLPVGQPRAKATTFGGRTRMYTPATTKLADGSKREHPIVLFKAMVRQCAAKAMEGVAKATGPVWCDVEAVFPRPASKPKWIAKGSWHDACWKDGMRMPHIAKPDRDNLEKSLLDAMKDIAFVDDKQVCGGEVKKFVGSKADDVGVKVMLQWEV